MRGIPPITGPVRFTVPSSKVEEFFFLSFKLYLVRRHFTQHTIWIIGPGMEGGRREEGGEGRRREEGGEGRRRKEGGGRDD